LSLGQRSSQLTPAAPEATLTCCPPRFTGQPLDGHTPRFIRTDNAPAVAQLAGTELYIQTGPTPWGVPGLSEAMLQRVRRQGGVLLVVTHGLWEGIGSPADAVKALQARGTMGSWIALKN
ncbi:hypothetical protein ACFWUT_35280, partial [Streptomyces cyaneofuscatus]|uniref:hypothetical protein n=1 Tax=Streptomyces cyaneofuscatus TaxID=66883 RepID=UPI00365C4D2C